MYLALTRENGGQIGGFALPLALTDEQTRRLRLAGQNLLCSLPDGNAAPAAVVRNTGGLQAQDIFAASLGVRVRSHNSTYAAVDRARYDDRSIVWTWAMRGTLHLLPAADLDWLLPLVGEVFVTAAARRRRELGLDEDLYAQGLRVIRRRLAEHGPSTRAELVAALASAGIEGGYRIERHLLYRAGLEGVICLGPDRGAKPAFVLLDDWLGRPLDPVAPAAALKELVARYLAAYAPATPADLAAWSGLPAAMLREGWAAIAGGLTEVTVAGKPAWIPASRLAELDLPPAPANTVQLLPAFDTYLLGHRSRALILDPAHADRVNAGGGMIHPVLLLDGQIAGTWRSNRQGRRVKITLEPFSPLPPQTAAGIAAETADIERFVGDSG
ncbi:MAG TPA: winged helix DNA-binding domain-containing protein [Anaerolineae bacterium]